MANNNNFSRIMLTGNLTADPRFAERAIAATGEIKHVADFTVATNFEHRDGRKDVTYTKVSLWGADADQAMKTLKKGALVKVNGTAIVDDTWTGRNGKTYTDKVLKGVSKVEAWSRDAKAWAEVTIRAKAESTPAPQATAETAVVAEAQPAILAEVLPF